MGFHVYSNSIHGVNQSIPENLEKDSPNVYIIGSGDFGRALAGRLAKSGYRVTIASRDAGARNG